MTTASSLIGRFYYLPHLLLVLQFQLDLRHLCDLSPQEAPVGLGNLVAPEGPAAPVDQELPAGHEHCQRTERNIRTHKGSGKKEKNKQTKH